MSLLHHLIHVLLHTYARHEFPVLFGLLVIEEAGVPLPLPGDTLVALAGARTFSLGYTLAILATTTAAVFIGSTTLYYLMRRGGRPFLEKYGKFLHLTPKRLAKVEGWFQRRGPLAIFLGRLIPGLRVPTTVMAGISAVPYRVYLPAALASAAIWALFYFFAGMVLQRSAARVAAVFTGRVDDAGDLAVVLLFIALAITAFIVFLLHRRGAFGRPPAPAD